MHYMKYHKNELTLDFICNSEYGIIYNKTTITAEK